MPKMQKKIPNNKHHCYDDNENVPKTAKPKQVFMTADMIINTFYRWASMPQFINLNYMQF